MLYRRHKKKLEVMLVHPGGPFFKNKDNGAWSIPKGEFTGSEKALDAARREFEEETGMACNGDFIELAPVKLTSGKKVYAWALEKDIDTAAVKSNTFMMEWPPKSGRQQQFPEIDKAQWFEPVVARQKINGNQVAFIDELVALLAAL